MPRNVTAGNDLDGVIRADECYTLDALMRRMKIREEALRAAFRNGLKSALIGNRKFVLGQSVIDYLAKVGGDSCNGRE